MGPRRGSPEKSVRVKVSPVCVQESNRGVTTGALSAGYLPDVPESRRWRRRVVRRRASRITGGRRVSCTLRRERGGAGWRGWAGRDISFLGILQVPLVNRVGARTHLLINVVIKIVGDGL